MYDLAQHFIGKVCTIFTIPISNTSLNPSQMANYFMGLILEIDEHGILTQQISTGFKSYFPWDKIVTIAEEELVTDSKELERIEKKIEKSKAEFQENKAKMENQVSQLNDSPYLNADGLSALINQAKSASE